MMRRAIRLPERAPTEKFPRSDVAAGYAALRYVAARKVAALIAIATTIFTFRSKSKLSKSEIKQEIVRKARHALKRAALAT